MGFEKLAIDVSVYQGDIDWTQVKAAGVYAAVLRAGYGRYIDQEDKKFRQNYERARAAGVPVGAYWFSYAQTPEQAAREADACLAVLAGRALQMPLYFDQEENAIPAASRTACAVAFLDRLRRRGFAGLTGYYTYTAYFATMDIPTIQAHADTIWLADYRQNYDRTIPRDMHQYSSSGSVPGISGRVDMNRLYRDFPAELAEKEDTPMYTSDTLKIGPASAGDKRAIRTLAESLALPVAEEGDCLIVGPMSAGDRATVSNKALALGLGCEDYTPALQPEAPEDEPGESEPADEPDKPTEGVEEIMAALNALAERLDELIAGHKALRNDLTAAAKAFADVD